jgi:hypothetical protein
MAWSCEQNVAMVVWYSTDPNRAVRLLARQTRTAFHGPHRSHRRPGGAILRKHGAAVRTVARTVRWHSTRPRWLDDNEILFDRDPGWLANLLAPGAKRERKLWIVDQDGRRLRRPDPASDGLHPESLAAFDRLLLLPNPRDAAATNVARLLENGPWDQPDWSHDGSRLAVASLRSRGGDGEIHAGRADGSDLRPLTDDGREKFPPRWSPVGRLLAFEVTEPGAVSLPKLCVTGIDSVALRCFGDYDGELWVHWSPDGRHLAYVGDLQLTVADVENGSTLRVARLNPGDDSGEILPAARRRLPTGASWPSAASSPTQRGSRSSP